MGANPSHSLYSIEGLREKIPLKMRGIPIQKEGKLGMHSYNRLSWRARATA